VHGCTGTLLENRQADEGERKRSVWPCLEEFGQCLATAAQDGRICIWRDPPRAPAAAAAAATAAAAEEGAMQWEQCAALRDTAVPTRHLAFAPAEFGLQLAAAGDDGVVRFYSPTDTLALAGWQGLPLVPF
jgi:hypothetical protein